MVEIGSNELHIAVFDVVFFQVDHAFMGRHFDIGWARDRFGERRRKG
jgi:hypothetical protein